jgi:hypothetical protein
VLPTRRGRRLGRPLSNRRAQTTSTNHKPQTPAMQLDPAITDVREPPLRSTRSERHARDPVVRAAIANVAANLQALSPSELLQLVLFPDTLTEWSSRAGRTPAQVFNMQRRTRPYAQLRIALADRLQVPLAILSHLIDADPGPPAAHELPERVRILADAGLSLARDAQAPIAWDRPPYPPYRDGSNPLERLALARLEAEAPAMPGTSLVSLALFPDRIATWARAHGYHFNRVLSSLSGTRRFAYLDTALARRLGVTVDALDDFIRARKREPLATQPPSIER